MTIGLIILGVVAILAFFGLLERFFIKLGLKSWVALILVLGLVVGAVVPPIVFGTALSISIGGFIAPLVVVIVLLGVAKNRSESFRAVVAMLAVASVAVATRMLLAPLNASLILAASLIIGFVGGASAFLAGHTRVASVSSAIGGIILGDVIIGLIRFFVGGDMVVLGAQGVFDSLIIAAIFSLLVCEAIGAIKRVNLEKRGARVMRGRELAMAEAAEDEDVAGNETSNEIGKEDSGEQDAKDTQEQCPQHENNFFDEYIGD